MPASPSTDIDVGGRRLKVSNLDKVLYPATGFTKGQVIDYYARIAPVMLPHVAGRPLTLKRYPNGVEGQFFYEKNCPSHRPDWVNTAPVETSTKVVNYCLVEDVAGLVWLANLASIEIHPLLAVKDDVQQPTKLTFDLDPGEPASIIECCAVALEVRAIFEHFEMRAFPKTSGSKGMQIEVPLNTPVTYGETKPFALAVAQLLESRLPGRVVSKMDKALRKGKVLIDWSQNDDSKTTVSVYSLRAKSQPEVSTPVSWDEVEEGAAGKALFFTADEVLERVDGLGDLQAPVLTLRQKLPDLSGA